MDWTRGQPWSLHSCVLTNKAHSQPYTPLYLSSPSWPSASLNIDCAPIFISFFCWCAGICQTCLRHKVPRERFPGRRRFGFWQLVSFCFVFFLAGSCCLGVQQLSSNSKHQWIFRSKRREAQVAGLTDVHKSNCCVNVPYLTLGSPQEDNGNVLTDGKTFFTQSTKLDNGSNRGQDTKAVLIMEKSKDMRQVVAVVKVRKQLKFMPFTSSRTIFLR